MWVDLWGHGLTQHWENDFQTSHLLIYLVPGIEMLRFNKAKIGGKFKFLNMSNLTKWHTNPFHAQNKLYCPILTCFHKKVVPGIVGAYWEWFTCKWHSLYLNFPPILAILNLSISIPGTSKLRRHMFETHFLSAGLTYDPKNRPT